MKGLDYENGEELTPCGELRGQTTLVGEGSRPYLYPLSSSSLPFPFFLLPCTTKTFRVIYAPIKAKDTSEHCYFQFIWPTLDPSPPSPRG